MAMNSLESIKTIYYNPFIFTPIFGSFYSFLSTSEKNLMLAYLVLPLVLYPSSQAALKNSKSSSTIHSLFTERGKEERTFGVSGRIKLYKQITNESMQYAFINNALKLGKDLSISVVNKNWFSNKLCSKNVLKASEKLGILFSKYDIQSCYGMLGVKKI